MHFLLKLGIVVVATCLFPESVLSQMQSMENTGTIVKYHCPKKKHLKGEETFELNSLTGNGKYKYVHMTSLESCEDSGDLDTWPFSYTFTKNENDEYILIFNVTLLKDIDADMKFFITAQRWFTGSGWKTYYPFDDVDICSNGCNQFPEIMEAVFESMGLPFDSENPENNCPIPAGEYIGKPAKVRFHLAKFPELPYGESRVIFSIMDGDERGICVIGGGEVVPEGNGNRFG